MDYKITVFISYSWENEIHNKKVERFVKRLRENHIDVFFDRDMPLGERFTDFMELIDISDYVLFLCTPKYKEKADKGLGGVKYEKNIITAELYEKGNERKFIPVLFSGTWNESLPIWAKGKLGIDYTREADDEFNRLLRNIQLNGVKSDVDIKPASNYIFTPLNKKKSIKYIIIGLLSVFVLAVLLFNFNGELQQKYDGFINRISNYINTYIKKDDLHVQETEKNNENEMIVPLKEFPFRVEQNVIYPETKVIKVPTPEESGAYSVEIPLDLRAEEYQSEKVPINADIHGFVVNNLYYCSDDDSVTDISEYNYYKFADYWLYLHTINLSFMDFDGFELMFNGATIVLQEKETQKRIVLQEDYLNGDFVQFKCSTGQYIIEIQKEGIAYTANLNISKNEKTFLAISPDDYYYLSPNDEDSYIINENNDKVQSNDESTLKKEDPYIKEASNGSEDEIRKDTDIVNDNSQVQQYPDDYVITWEDETFGRLMQECLNKDQIIYADVKDVLSIEIFDNKIILNEEGEEEELDYNLNSPTNYNEGYIKVCNPL